MYCTRIICIHITYTLHETNIALRKLMLGRRSFPFGARPIFRCFRCSFFRDCIQSAVAIQLRPSYGWENLPGVLRLVNHACCCRSLYTYNYYSPEKLTWPLKKAPFLKGNFKFQPSIFRGYVSFGWEYMNSWKLVSSDTSSSVVFLFDWSLQFQPDCL